MKFIHLSDLHIGKAVSPEMIEDQREMILGTIVPAIAEAAPDAVLIAGDIFDRANPAAEAIALFDDFLYELTRLPKRTEVFIISGNHDGAERIAFGSRIMDRSGLHLSPVYRGKVEPFTMRDGHGEVDIWMLPFVREATVRYYFPDEEIGNENEAVAHAVKAMGVRGDRRNVCVAHQFVTGASLSGSEESSVGGVDQVGADAFACFDYVALGHIHGPQNITDRIRYSGSPLKYSFSEVSHRKSMTLAELNGDGTVNITEIPLVPRNDWFDVRGTFREVTSPDYVAAHPEFKGGYLRMTLTDETEVIDGFKSLKALYPHMLEMRYDNTRTKSSGGVGGLEPGHVKTDEEIIAELFMMQNGRELDERELNFIKETIR